MSGPRTFLEDLALVLGVAALTTVLFRRLRQPVVLGYLLAGLIVGPYLPLRLPVDPERIHTLSELGIILVMFSVGLAFSFRKLAEVIPTAGLTGFVQISLMIWLGYLVGQALGWTGRESLFTGAIVAISSTMVVTKVFAERGIRGRLAELVYGVLIVEDVVAVLLLAVLTPVASGAGLPAGMLAMTAGRLAAFLLGMVVIGFLVVPRVMRAAIKLGSPETLLVTSIGICFAFALVAQKLGYSVALGAFLAGSLMAESEAAEELEQLIRPVRDMFAAVFFVSVGMLVDPAVILEQWPAVAALTGVVLVGQVVSVSLGSFLGGNDVRTAVQTGMSLAQIGEFSFIIAGLGVSSGAIGSFLYATTVAVAVLTSFMTPWLVRVSEPVALYLDRRLPRPLQTFVALYGTWVEQVRAGRQGRTPRARRRRLVRYLVVDVAAIAGIIIGTSVALKSLIELATRYTGLPSVVSRGVIIAGALVLASPFAVGVVRTVRALGALLATAALPAAPKGKVDLAAAPRRALIVTLQLVLLLIAGIPLLALTQPFLPFGYGAAVLAIALVSLGIAFWRSATNLQAHVRAGAEMVVQALAKQARTKQRPTLEQVHRMLPGLGALTPVEIGPSSPHVGKTLAEMNLRGLTGASVIAITRGAGGVVVPTGREALRVGDVLALAGTREAIDAARKLLLGEHGPETPPPGPRTPEPPREGAG